MFCKNCGSVLSDGALFCAKCGTRTSQPAAPAPNQPVLTQPVQQASPFMNSAPAPTAPVPQAAAPFAPNTAAARPSNKKKIIVIAAVAVVLIASVIVAVVVAMNSSSKKSKGGFDTPEKAAEELVKAYYSIDYDRMFNVVAPPKFLKCWANKENVKPKDIIDEYYEDFVDGASDAEIKEFKKKVKKIKAIGKEKLDKDDRSEIYGLMKKIGLEVPDDSAEVEVGIVYSEYEYSRDKDDEYDREMDCYCFKYGGRWYAVHEDYLEDALL